MKPKITFQEGNRLIIVNSREFSEIPPINQELELRDQRYKVTSYESVVVNVKPVPDAPEAAPQRTLKAKRTAKKQAKVAAKSKKAGKTTGDGKTAATAVKGKWYNSKSN